MYSEVDVYFYISLLFFPLAEQLQIILCKISWVNDPFKQGRLQRMVEETMYEIPAFQEKPSYVCVYIYLKHTHTHQNKTKQNKRKKTSLPQYILVTILVTKGEKKNEKK